MKQSIQVMELQNRVHRSLRYVSIHLVSLRRAAVNDKYEMFATSLGQDKTSESPTGFKPMSFFWGVSENDFPVSTSKLQLA